MKEEGERQENQRDPGGLVLVRGRGCGWPCRPPADIPSSMEEMRQECHPGLAPPSILSSPVRSLLKAPREVGGAGGLP